MEKEGVSAPSSVPWDARLARWVVRPLAASSITPNHLTTLRLAVGLAAAAWFARGTYAACNIGALLACASNFLDHTDGELARIAGKSSRFGHVYDLISDALVTITLFVAIGIGAQGKIAVGIPTVWLGALSGGAIALIFILRLRIEDRMGKAGTQQAAIAGFEIEDMLYTLPLLTLLDATVPMLLLSAVCAPLFAVWVVVDYRRKMRMPVPEGPPQADTG
jgi:phosphatidylglycerophosphate synthase